MLAGMECEDGGCVEGGESVKTKKLTEQDIGYVSEPVSEYVAGVGAAKSVRELLDHVTRYKFLAFDAWSVVLDMTDADWPVWRDGHRKSKREDQSPDDAWFERYASVIMPDVMFRVSMVAEQFAVPWGCAYIRLREEGLIKLSRKRCPKGSNVAVWVQEAKA